MTDNPAILTKSDFAKLLGLVPSYVTALIKAGRVVLDGDGRSARVRVAESLALIEATQGGRFDVARRHASTRRQGANAGAGIPMVRSTPENGSKRDSDDVRTAWETERANSRTENLPNNAVEIGNSYQAARTVREKYAAMTAKAQYETLIKQLIPADEVNHILDFSGATIRALLEMFPDQHASMLTPMKSNDEVHEYLTQAVQHVSNEFLATLDKLKTNA